ncbi:hypothetical protein [Paracidovorax wautersii]|uniref:hypothetical protein n=1 Tax=Paracidovorax wautersii TaxID=1177982 RepID=UPI0031DFC005
MTLSRQWSACIAAALITGCAANAPVRTWKPFRDDAAPLDRAMDRCEYESTAATQQPNYSVGYWVRDIDQQNRRSELMNLCMRAQGYTPSTVAEGIGPQSPATWAKMEADWAAARKERATLRARLDSAPAGTDTEQMSERIRQLNSQVRMLERQLSYSLTPPVDAEPSMKR